MEKLYQTAKCGIDFYCKLRYNVIKRMHLTFCGYNVSRARIEGCFSFYSCSVLYFGVVGDSKDVIGRNLIKCGKLNQNIGWNIPLSELVIGIDLLGFVYNYSHLLLCKVLIFAQFSHPVSVTHKNTPSIALCKHYIIIIFLYGYILKD